MSASQVSVYMFEQLEKPALLPHAAPADVLSAARAEAEMVRAQAREDGHAAGYAEGLERAQAEVAPALAAMADAARTIEALRDELVQTLESQAAELALRVAEQILTAAVHAEPERIVDVTRAALRRLSDRHRVTVLVNPEDLDVMSRSSEALQGELGGIDHIDVQSDRRITRGGVIVRTDYGEIDASITTQLQNARDLVTATLAPPDDENDLGLRDSDDNPEAPILELVDAG